MSRKHRPARAAQTAIHAIRNAHPPQNQNPLSPLFPNGSLLAASMELYSGPIPSPDALEKYKAIHPELPDVWIRRWEKQSDHRMDLEKTNLISSSHRADLGVRYAFILTLTLIIVVGLLVYLGHDAGGSVFAGSGIVGLAGTFIYGTSSRREERKERTELMTGKKPGRH